MPEPNQETAPRGNRRRHTVRLAATSLVSLGTLACLLILMEPASVSSLVAEFRPGWALLACLFAATGTVLRGWRLQLMHGSDRVYAPLVKWMRVAAMHQILASTLPSGLGDVSFPLLVKRRCGLSLPAGARLVAAYRLQDVAVLAGFLGLGLMYVVADRAVHPFAIVASIIIALMAVAGSDRLTYYLFRQSAEGARHLSSSRIIGKGATHVAHLLDDAAALQRATPWRRRLAVVLMTLLTWISAIGTFWSLFATVDVYLPLVALCFVIGGLNLVGAVAGLSIAGVGVGETALTGLLVTLGFAPVNAVSTSLVVRPAALASVLVANGFIELCCRESRSLKPVSRPTN